MDESKEVKKKSIDDYYEDIIEYISQRILLSINATEDKEAVEYTKSYVDAVLFLITNDESIKETLHRIINIDDLKDEFDDKFSKRYDFVCSCCDNKESDNDTVGEPTGGC